MTDTASQVEIEDVLASVRRLVSVERVARPEPAARAPDRLVLTPDFRVADRAAAPGPRSDDRDGDTIRDMVNGAVVANLPGRGDADTAVDDAETAESVTLEQRIAELEAAILAGSPAEEFEPDGSEGEAQHRPSAVPQLDAMVDGIVDDLADELADELADDIALNLTDALAPDGVDDADSDGQATAAAEFRHAGPLHDAADPPPAPAFVRRIGPAPRPEAEINNPPQPTAAAEPARARPSILADFLASVRPDRKAPMATVDDSAGTLERVAEALADDPADIDPRTPETTDAATDMLSDMGDREDLDGFADAEMSDRIARALDRATGTAAPAPDADRFERMSSEDVAAFEAEALHLSPDFAAEPAAGPGPDLPPRPDAEPMSKPAIAEAAEKAEAIDALPEAGTENREPPPEQEYAHLGDDREPLDLGADTQEIDEEILRDMVAEIVRRELQGSLGERITRNVRKLVRREIQRALTIRELE